MARVTTLRAYTIQEFYKAIENKTFSVGKPSLKRMGPAWLITFPPVIGSIRHVSSVLSQKKHNKVESGE